MKYVIPALLLLAGCQAGSPTVSSTLMSPESDRSYFEMETGAMNADFYMTIGTDEVPIPGAPSYSVVNYQAGTTRFGAYGRSAEVVLNNTGAVALTVLIYRDGVLIETHVVTGGNSIQRLF